MTLNVGYCIVQEGSTNALRHIVGQREFAMGQYVLLGNVRRLMGVGRRIIETLFVSNPEVILIEYLLDDG